MANLLNRKVIHRHRQVIWLNVVFWLGMFLAHFYVQYNPKTGFETTPQLISFGYGMLLNVLTIYCFAYWAAPAYVQAPALRTLMKYNLIFLAVITLGETLIDCVHQWIFDDFYQVQNRGMAYFGRLWGTNVLFTLFILTMANLYAFSLSWIRDIERRELEEKEKLKAELALMKQQVHPHFLFNTLNNLFGLACEAGNEKVADGISKLAEIMRYMTYETTAELVPVESEIRYLQSFVDLQKLRLGQQVPVRFEVSGEPGQQQISPLLLLPFIENCFKHGISFIDPYPIEIQIKTQADAIEIRTRNKIYAKEEQKPVGGFGLENVRMRLELLYPGRHQLRIRENEGVYEVQLGIQQS